MPATVHLEVRRLHMDHGPVAGAGPVAALSAAVDPGRRSLAITIKLGDGVPDGSGNLLVLACQQLNRELIRVIRLTWAHGHCCHELRLVSTASQSVAVEDDNVAMGEIPQ